jgi:DNA-binding beta-propeller fold protein YncE
MLNRRQTMAERQTEREEPTSGPGWTRRAITGLLAGTGFVALTGAEADAKKKKKGKGTSRPKPPTCTRTCGGRECGSDGCGGSCGTCGAGTSCEAGQCLATEPYVFDRQWGSFGTSGESKFNLPWGIAVDVSDNVYVADSGNDRIQKFSSTGQFLLEWGARGDEDLEFFEPAGVSGSPTGHIYVTDSRNNRIQKFTSLGEHRLTWGTVGLGDGQLQRPQEIAVNQTGSLLYIVESQTNRVQEFADATYIRTFDFPDLGAFEARGGAVDTDGNVYVVNYSGGLVYRLAGDGSIAQTFGSPGSGNGQFSGPYDVAVDDDGNLFVVDRGNNRIQVLNKNGALITAWGTFGAGEGQFKQPIAIYLDSAGNVYVTDLSNARVQKFRPSSQRRRQW